MSGVASVEKPTRNASASSLVCVLMSAVVSIPQIQPGVVVLLPSAMLAVTGATIVSVVPFHARTPMSHEPVVCCQPQTTSRAPVTFSLVPIVYVVIGISTYWVPTPTVVWVKPSCAVVRFGGTSSMLFRAVVAFQAVNVGVAPANVEKLAVEPVTVTVPAPSTKTPCTLCLPIYGMFAVSVQAVTSS